MSPDSLVSIVIPTYNEQEDIRRTLDAIMAIRYPHKEVIVVDDSTDRTPDIVREYEDRAVRLIRPEVSRGRCGARNVGILNARGEIVVILNADNLLPPDFIDRILVHYENGADYVLPDDEVSNREFLFPRYISASHHMYYDDARNRIEWREGLSCRRSAAIAVGMFPDWPPIPICAGEDGYFGMRLAGEDGYGGRKERVPYRRVEDRSIVVFHIAPHRFRDFWHQRYGRGKGTPQRHFFLGKMRLSKLFLHTLAKVVWLAGGTALILPVLVESLQLTRFSPSGIKDWLPFWYAHSVARLAEAKGEWDGFVEIIQAIRVGRITEYIL